MRKRRVHDSGEGTEVSNMVAGAGTESSHQLQAGLTERELETE